MVQNETKQFQTLKKVFQGLCGSDDYKALTNLQQDQKYFLHALLQSFLEKRNDTCVVSFDTSTGNLYDDSNATCLSVASAKECYKSKGQNPVTCQAFAQETKYYAQLKYGDLNPFGQINVSRIYRNAYEKAQNVIIAMSVGSILPLPEAITSHANIENLLRVESAYIQQGNYEPEINIQNIVSAKQSELLIKFLQTCDNPVALKQACSSVVIINDTDDAQEKLRKQAIKGMLDSEEFNTKFNNAIGREGNFEKFLKWICKAVITAYKYVETLFRIRRYDMQQEIRGAIAASNHEIEKLFPKNENARGEFVDYVKQNVARLVI
jgi:hypothetical protein